jgi:hypothetical protein
LTGAALYEREGIRVTAAAVQSDGHSIALAQVTHVALERGGGLGWALLLFLLGGVLLIASARTAAFIALALAAAQAVRARLRWRIVLSLADRSRVTLTTYNATHARSLFQAISAALPRQ